MKNFLFSLLAILILISGCSREKYQTQSQTDSNGYTYEEVTNDPSGLRIYTLDNGLKVYMAPNAAEPRVMAMIGVKAGSTSDPEETTGLAHYFEHIMFKGTSSFGTTSWEAEKPLLDSISNLFEIYRSETDETKRAELYKQIDKVSYEASKYAIANEYDKMVLEMGAEFTNAFTSYEVTAYMNNIPANELRRWLALEYNRFGDVALRLFHTELETVYEEFNMYQDRDWSRASVALQKGLFPNHPYGRDIIGYPEHLKNPSMVNIMQFKEMWYVPNNMVISLAGDLDMDAAIVMIDETFGLMEAKPLPDRPIIREEPIIEPIEIEVTGPDAESLLMAWRLDENTLRDRDMAYLIANILYNGEAGLIDLNLIQEQQLLDAWAYPDNYREYTVIQFSANPKEEQTIEETRDLLLKEIEKLKNGEFADWMPTAIANQQRLSMLRNFEENWKAFTFLDAYIKEESWAENLAMPDRIEKISKQEIVEYANNLFKNNYVAVFKRTGVPTDLIKVPKPPITPVVINRDDRSTYYTDWNGLPRDTILPVFLDFDNEIETAQLTPDVKLSYIPNTTNEFFTHYYIIDAGKNHNLKTPIAFNFIPFTGTANYSAAGLKQELFRYGLLTNVFSSNDRSWVYISGLNRNYEKGLELMEEILTSALPDSVAYAKYAERTIKQRNDRKLDIDNIMWGGLMNRAIYGIRSPFNDVLTDEQIRQTNPQELTNLVATHVNYPHQVFYYGPSPLNEVEAQVKKYHKLPETLTPIPSETVYPEADIIENEVLLVHYEMSQVNVLLMGKGQPFSKDLYVKANLFNQYFGNSMSSIVFQEIREAQGLAYSAFIGYDTPSRPDHSFYLSGYIGTQPDKLTQATQSFDNLLDKLIENEQSFEISRNGVLNSISTSRIIKDDIFFQKLNNEKFGFTSDMRREWYNDAQTATMDELSDFYNNYVKDQPYSWFVVGDTTAINRNMISKLGMVKIVTVDELFGY